LDTAGHKWARRGPDVARGPDVVHHWCRSTGINCWTSDVFYVCV